jgi:hypothetical protein
MKYNEYFNEAWMQSIGAYRELLLGNPMAFMSGSMRAWTLWALGSFGYWRE